MSFSQLGCGLVLEFLPWNPKVKGLIPTRGIFVLTLVWKVDRWKLVKML